MREHVGVARVGRGPKGYGSAEGLRVLCIVFCVAVGCSLLAVVYIYGIRITLEYMDVVTADEKQRHKAQSTSTFRSVVRRL